MDQPKSAAMPTITLVGGGRTGTALWQGRIGQAHQIEIEVAEPAPTASDSVITACEKRIRDLEAHKTLLRERIALCGKPMASFRDTY